VTDAKLEGTTKTLTFEYSDGDLEVVKRLVFRDDSYEILIDSQVRQHGAAVNAYPQWASGFGDATVPASYAAARVDYNPGDKVERQAGKKVGGGETVGGPFVWAGTLDQYFAAIFLPNDPQQVDMVTMHHAMLLPKNPAKPDPTETVPVSVLGAAVGNRSGHT